jgi:serine phosphatase RsbU (regulator of sigma subunit)
MWREMGGRIRLPARIALAVGAGAVAVGLGVALLLGNTTALRGDAGATIANSGYLAAVSDVERLVVDAETGLRGYVITGRTLFLQPLNAAVARFRTAAAALRRAATRVHAFTGQAEGLVQVSRSYLSSYVPRVLRMGSRDMPAARSYAVTLEGKQLVDRIRARTAALERAVSARQNARQRTARSSANHAVAEALAVLVVLTVLTVLLGTFLGRLALARDRAHARSERTAGILQRSLLPDELPAVPGCELAVRFRPAGQGELVGGDFYDVFAVGARWAIVLGDVCGKGADAAAVTAMARWSLRSFAPREGDPAAPLRFLNELMLRQDLGGRFITIAYLLLSMEHDRVRVSVACAGHPPPIHVPADGDAVALSARGTLLGVWPHIRFETARLTLLPGDGLVAYTDGVTDQGAHFRSDAPAAMLRDASPRASADVLAALVESYANQLRGPQRDDIAILALRFRGEAADRDAPPAGPDLVDRVVLQSV